MTYQKLNESFYQISGTPEQLQEIKRKFTIKIPNSYFDPMIKRGLKPDSEVFYVESGTDIIIPSGLVQFLTQFNITPIYTPEFTEEEILKHIESLGLPFPLYDYQEKMVVDSLINQQQLCLAATSSGKSLVLFCIVTFLYKHNKKGLILVPNISLTEQLFGDFKEYLATDDFLDNIRLIGGDNNIKELDKPLTISTWQSVMRIPQYKLLDLEYMLVDECLHPNTKISTPLGNIMIKNLKVGDEVNTINEKTLKKETKRIKKIHRNISKEQMYIINEKLRITGNHKVLTTKGWKRTDELEIGDKIINDL